jgi:DNA polymerase-3 subunit epsilon
VDSSFAANWWYWHAARTVFPERSAELISWRQSRWIAVEREGAFPRLKRATDLSDPDLRYAGPIRDRTSAGKLVEALEDLFDLCRYHQELIQAPHGKPCAYKEMGKCPAPCDGSVPISWYRQQMAKAWSFLTGESRQRWREEVMEAMKTAAGRLEFETAGRLKQRLARAEVLETDAYAHLAPLEDFAYLTLQPGKGKPWVEPWLIHAGQATCLPQVNAKDLPGAAEKLTQQARDLLAEPSPAWFMADQSEQIAVVAHHLFKGDADHGTWLRLRDLAIAGPRLILEAAESLRSRRARKPLVEQSSDKTGSSDERAKDGAQASVCENLLSETERTDK